MDEILNILNDICETKMNLIKTDFSSRYQHLQGSIKAMAAITHEQPETAIMDIYIFETDVKREAGFIADNIVNGSRKYVDYQSPEQKDRDKQSENEYKQLKRTEYIKKYGDDMGKVYHTLVDLTFKFEFLSMINKMICKDSYVYNQFRLINMNNVNVNELKSVLLDMTEYYASQSTDYKPIKSFIDKTWDNENISILCTGAGGAAWGAILGGPIGMIAGAALAGMWADGKKKETYRNTRDLYIQKK